VPVGVRWLWHYKTPRCMLSRNITPPTKAVWRKCPLAIPVPRGPYRLGAHAPGRPRGRVSPLSSSTATGPTATSHRHRSSSPMSSPGLGVGQRRPESAIHVPCSMRWSGCCTHTFAPCQQLCVRSQSHSECSPRAPWVPIPTPSRPGTHATKNHSMHSGVGPGRQEGNAPEDVEDGHRLLEEGEASAPRGRQGIGS
jgi:hypothetical protein